MQIYHAIFYNHPLTDKKYVVLFLKFLVLQNMINISVFLVLTFPWLNMSWKRCMK